MSKKKKFDRSIFYPKRRTGKECKKTECARHDSYLKWNCGDHKLDWCMECKHAHISQYKKKEL